VAEIALKNRIEMTRLQQVALKAFSLFRELRLRDVEEQPTEELDRLVQRFLTRHGMQSALRGYRDYPAHSSVSCNEVAIHGVPGSRRIVRGDVFSLDVAATGGGWVADSAWTYLMPGSSHRSMNEYTAAWTAFSNLIRSLHRGMTLADLSRNSQQQAQAQGLSIVSAFTGHGIGRSLHEPPVISFVEGDQRYQERAARIRLETGMVFNIEPVYCAGEAAMEPSQDGWGFRTRDKSRTYHFELTVAVREDYPVIMQFGGLPVADLPGSVPFGLL
jgi:methionyl aminopeptidase